VAADKAQTKQKTFASPEEAAKAVIAAAKAGDSKELTAIFVPWLGKGFCNPAYKVADKEARERFAKAAEEAERAREIRRCESGPHGREGQVAVPGSDREGGLGLAVRRRRRQGRNPQPPHRAQSSLFTVQSVLAYGDAQREYYTRNPDNSKLLHYAQKMVSSAGKRDGSVLSR
jgi:hypothetical protein